MWHINIVSTSTKTASMSTNHKIHIFAYTPIIYCITQVVHPLLPVPVPPSRLSLPPARIVTGIYRAYSHQSNISQGWGKLTEADLTEARSPEAETVVSCRRVCVPHAKQPGHHDNNATFKERRCCSESFLIKAAGGGRRVCQSKDLTWHLKIFVYSEEN